MQSDRAMVISRWWASLLASLLVAIILGGTAYAWSTNAQIAVMQSDVNDLKGAKIDVRLARMEEKIDWLVRVQTQEKRK